MFRKLAKLALKARLMSAFRSGDLFLKYANTAIYPRINAVMDDTERTTFVFSIPLGLDPAKVEKSFVFAQAFGPNIDLDRENKVFRLTVYKHRLPNRYAYDYAAILPHISRLKLPIIAGMGRKGFEAYDMTANPHLLVAGETGAGKSTHLRAILTTLIQYVQPGSLELYLGDLKRSEFHMFRRCQHVKEVAVKIPDVGKFLHTVKNELERRGNLLDEYEATNIDDLPANMRPPYIVVCIDEVALLKKESAIMDTIENISAIGRALGVFLNLSMQRPDADVLDGKLKQNLTVRMAFRHADAINSRITLGSDEAAVIGIGQRGRMYMKREGLTEVQSPYLSEAAAKRILAQYKQKAPTQAPAEREKSTKVLGVLDDA